ncbi:MAG: DUF6473 family protein [Cyanobacteria bacterium J06621_11]
MTDSASASAAPNEPSASANSSSADVSEELAAKPVTEKLTAAQPPLKKTPMVSGSAEGYQRQDAEIVDYKIWKLWTQKAAFLLRGPKPMQLSPGGYCTSLGAAFTFGRFVAQPYAQLLGETLGISSLNLGFSGVGPSFYNYPQNQALIDLMNRSKFVTISIFSGRSQSNSLFRTARHSQERYILSNGTKVPADFAYQNLLETADRETVAALVTETRAAYMQEFSKLLAKITVPKVLVWFSRRSPDYEEGYDNLFALLSGFPHLVNRPMVETLKPLCDTYVEHVDSTGLPQPLISRFTQQPVEITRPRDYKKGKIQLKSSQLRENNYYASPQMHRALAKKLVTACQPWR